MKTKNLRRSLKDSVIGGVAGGLGDYFDTDPVIFRILFVVLALTGGGGVFVYLLMWIFIPKTNHKFNAYEDQTQNKSATQDTTNTENETEKQGREEDTAFKADSPDNSTHFGIPKKNGNVVGGTILILVGFFFLADDIFPWFNWEYLWPAALIIAGLAIIKINYNKKS